MIKEGLAEILFPEEMNVFYNPVQEFNRDLTVCVINTFSDYSKVKPIVPKKSKPKKSESDNMEGDVPEVNGEIINSLRSKLGIQQKPEGSLVILEALAASGIRSVRYALEVPSCYKVIANDIQKVAVETIESNSIHNRVQDIVCATHMDANVLMTLLPQAPLFFAPDVIDLDPYGSAAVFIDSAIRFIANGGLLCVTCTDMANLCGNHPASTFAKYFSVSVKSTFCHEMAVRILLYSLDLNANRYKRYIVPLLSISVDFYIRVFVRVLTSAEEVKASISRKSYVSVCSICNRFDLFPIANRLRPGVHHATQGPVGHSYCDICRGTTKLAGPVWNASLYDPEFVDLCLEQLKERGQNLATYDRVNGMLNVIKEELVDCPFFYHLDEMFSLVKSPMPKSLLIFSALSRLGYRFSYTHFKKNAFKTDAPAKIVWAVIREYCIKEYSKRPVFKVGSSDLTHLPSVEPDFTPILSLRPNSIKNRMVRFQMNPLPNWGPMKRSKVAKIDDISSAE